MIEFKGCLESLVDGSTSSYPETNLAHELEVGGRGDPETNPDQEQKVDSRRDFVDWSSGVTSKTVDLNLELDWELVLDIIDDIVSGLVDIHDHNTVHRGIAFPTLTFFQSLWKITVRWLSAPLADGQLSP